VDKVTIVSTGNGDAGGGVQTHRRHHEDCGTGAALFEALSGMQMSELLSKVRLIGDKAPSPSRPQIRRNHLPPERLARGAPAPQ